MMISAEQALAYILAQQKTAQAQFWQDSNKQPPPNCGRQQLQQQQQRSSSTAQQHARASATTASLNAGRRQPLLSLGQQQPGSQLSAGVQQPISQHPAGVQQLSSHLSAGVDQQQAIGAQQQSIGAQREQRYTSVRGGQSYQGQFDDDIVSAKTGAALKLMTPRPNQLGSQQQQPYSPPSSAAAMDVRMTGAPLMVGGGQGGQSPRHSSVSSAASSEGGTPAKTAQAPKLYKTELCRSWQESGHCNYGDRCQYAHGDTEVRPIPRHPKYKTEQCRTFHDTGYCPYGLRCHFVHDRSPQQQQQSRRAPIPQHHQQQNSTNNTNGVPQSVLPYSLMKSLGALSVNPYAAMMQQPPPMPQQHYCISPAQMMTPMGCHPNGAGVQMSHQQNSHHHQALGSAGESPVPSTESDSLSPASYSPPLVQQRVAAAPCAPEQILAPRGGAGLMATYYEDVFQAALPNNNSYMSAGDVSATRRFSDDPILDMLMLDVESTESKKTAGGDAPAPARLPVFARLSSN